MYSQGAEVIRNERMRQLNIEGWSLTQDTEVNPNGELARAAKSYIEATIGGPIETIPYGWPWADEWWKPSTRIRMLIKAGALIAAEIDRLVNSGEFE